MTRDSLLRRPLLSSCPSPGKSDVAQAADAWYNVRWFCKDSRWETHKEELWNLLAVAAFADLLLWPSVQAAHIQEFREGMYHSWAPSGVNERMAKWLAGPNTILEL